MAKYAKYVVNSRLFHGRPGEEATTYEVDDIVELTLEEAKAIGGDGGEYCAIRPVGAPVPAWRQREIASGKR